MFSFLEMKDLHCNSTEIDGVNVELYEHGFSRTVLQKSLMFILAFKLGEDRMTSLVAWPREDMKPTVTTR